MTTEPLYHDPRWLRYAESTGSVLGYIARYGAVLGIGGALMWGGYVAGMDAGRDDAFLEGCRAIAYPAACERAADLGRQLRVARMEPTPGHKYDRAEIEKLCILLREEVSPGVARHYGCPGAAL